MKINKIDKTTGAYRNRLRSSRITSVISISLVLFLIGLVSMILLFANRISDHVKENIGFSIILNEDIREIESLRLQKDLDASRFVKSTKYITKEEAAREFQAELGENFVDFLGYNPLLASIEVKLFAAYTHPDSLQSVKKELQKYNQIKEIYYQENLIHLINNNVKKISGYLMFFSMLLLLISIVLINNTIRLSIYAKRFIIHTMKLVGATHSFIRKPFIIESMIQGAIASVISIALLMGIINLLEREFNFLFSFKEYDLITILILSVLLAGLGISFLSAWFASNKYLKIKTDKLYY